MNAEKEVPIFGGKWQVEVRCTCLGSILQYGSFVNPHHRLFGGVNFHLVANLELRRGHQPKLRNKEHTVYKSLQAVAGGL